MKKNSLILVFLLLVNISFANNKCNAFAGENAIICSNEIVLHASTPEENEFGLWSVIYGHGVFDNENSNITLVRFLSFGENIFRWTIYCGEDEISVDEVTIISYFAIPYAGNDKSICGNQTLLDAAFPDVLTGFWSVLSGGGDFDDIYSPITLVRNLHNGNNIFSWTLVKEFCSFSDYITISSTTFDTTIREEDGKLISNNVFPADYRWLDCDNDFAPIEGANGQEFIPTRSGNYSVQMAFLNCMEISDCYSFELISDISDNTFEYFTVVYPNPFDSKLNIKFNKKYKDVEILVYNQTGQLIHLEKQGYKQEITFSINEDAGSVFFVTVLIDWFKSETFKVLKK